MIFRTASRPGWKTKASRPATDTPPPEMAARIIQAVDHRLALVLQVAEATTPAEPDQSDRGF
jgi:hypothetical protein